MKMTPARRKLLEALAGKPKTAREVGDIVYPHLKGRGAMHGGPCACACAAAWQLGKLRAATRPAPWVDNHGFDEWQLTAAGAKALIDTATELPRRMKSLPRQYAATKARLKQDPGSCTAGDLS